MLSDKDIELMQDWRSDILTKRKRDITVVYTEKEYDSVNGTLVGEVERERDVKAIVTELSTSSSGGSRTIEDGVYHDECDAKFDISLDLIDDIARDLDKVIHDGTKYKILGMDKKGIGRRNRYEIIGEAVV